MAIIMKSRYTPRYVRTIGCVAFVLVLLISLTGTPTRDTNKAWAAPVSAGRFFHPPPVPDDDNNKKGQMSIHEYEMLLHRHRGENGDGFIAPSTFPHPSPRPFPRPSPGPGDFKDNSVNRIVYGYLPHWVSGIDELRWDLLTHVAYFAADINSSGEITSTPGWPYQSLMDAANNSDTKVHLTIVLFDNSAIGTLLADPSSRSNGVNNIIDAMENGGAHGVSIDFETPPESARDDFTTFLAELREEMDNRGLSDAEIAVAGPAWYGLAGIDIDAVLDYIDIYFIMAYPYFGSWSTRTGPVGKMRTSQDWTGISTLSTLRTVARYTSFTTAQKRRKIVIGVPYYGWHWTAADGSPGSAVISSVSSVYFNVAKEEVESQHTRLWDDGVQSPWYTWNDGNHHQVWYDDEESLFYKYILALEQDLGGIGMWALNYDNGYNELWDLLDSTFSEEPPVVEGDRFDPIRIQSFPYQDSKDTSEGPSNYFNYYSCAPDLAEYGREWVYRIDVCQSGTLSASVPEYPVVDPDLHLLDAPYEDACLARAHLDLEADITPGKYYLVVDTWVNDNDVPLEGSYTVSVDFTPHGGTQGCASHLVCDSGECICEGGLTDCGSECVNTDTDHLNCGECGNICDDGLECIGGECIVAGADGGTTIVDGGIGDGDTADASFLPCCPCPDTGGCGCKTIKTKGTGPIPGTLLLIILLLFSPALPMASKHRRN